MCAAYGKKNVGYLTKEMHEISEEVIVVALMCEEAEKLEKRNKKLSIPTGA